MSGTYSVQGLVLKAKNLPRFRIEEGTIGREVSLKVLG
jgi:hypothetical protein